MIRKHLKTCFLLLISLLALVSCGDDEELGLSPSRPVYKHVAYNFAFDFSPDLLEAANMQVELTFPGGGRQTFTTDDLGSPVYASVALKAIPQEVNVRVRCLRRSAFRPKPGTTYTFSSNMSYTMDVLNTADNPVSENLSIHRDILLLDARKLNETQADDVLDFLTTNSESPFMRTFTFKVTLQDGTYHIEAPNNRPPDKPCGLSI